MQIHTITTARLQIAYEDRGPSNGTPILLIHGWPDSLRTWDRILPALHDAGFRTIAPHLRGFGDTTFRGASIPRSGATAALAQDILDLADGLDLSLFTLVGHDWGTRALFDACILAPHRVRAATALSLGWAPASQPASLSWHQKQAFWYQWYLATPHGAEAFRADREGFCEHLWKTWSPPGWYKDTDWQAVKPALQNPDFTDVVISFYRARWGQPDAVRDSEDGDAMERIAAADEIIVPTQILHGLSDTCCLPELSADCASFFPGRYRRLTVPGVGHFPQREAPADIADNIISWSHMVDPAFRDSQSLDNLKS